MVNTTILLTTGIEAKVTEIVTPTLDQSTGNSSGITAATPHFSQTTSGRIETSSISSKYDVTSADSTNLGSAIPLNETASSSTWKVENGSATITTFTETVSSVVENITKTLPYTGQTATTMSGNTEITMSGNTETLMNEATSDSSTPLVGPSTLESTAAVTTKAATQIMTTERWIGTTAVKETMESISTTDIKTQTTSTQPVNAPTSAANVFTPTVAKSTQHSGTATSRMTVKNSNNTTFSEAPVGVKTTTTGKVEETTMSTSSNSSLILNLPPLHFYLIVGGVAAFFLILVIIIIVVVTKKRKQRAIAKSKKKSDGWISRSNGGIVLNNISFEPTVETEDETDDNAKSRLSGIVNAPAVNVFANTNDAFEEESTVASETSTRSPQILAKRQENNSEKTSEKKSKGLTPAIVPVVTPTKKAPSTDEATALEEPHSPTSFISDISDDERRQTSFLHSSKSNTKSENSDEPSTIESDSSGKPVRQAPPPPNRLGSVSSPPQSPAPPPVPPAPPLPSTGSSTSTGEMPTPPPPPPSVPEPPPPPPAP